MTTEQKKDLEIVGWIALEVTLVYLLAIWVNMPAELQAVLTIATVYFGKKIVKKCKE
jgi:hypothetical protein